MINNVKIKIERLNKELPLPYYATNGSAGMDLMANLKESIIIKPLSRAIIPTGIIIELPLGYEAQIRPRSGLAANYGITVLNSPGTIDSDYRGEIKIILFNSGAEIFNVEHKMRIAQMVISPVYRAIFDEVIIDSNNTERGAGGFGSTGLNLDESNKN